VKSPDPDALYLLLRLMQLGLAWRRTPEAFFVVARRAA
jgi:hypothetical protein